MLRARALLWLAVGRPVAEVAVLLLVSRQLVHGIDASRRSVGLAIDRLGIRWMRPPPLAASVWVISDTDACE